MKALFLSWNHPADHGGIERLVGDLQDQLNANGSRVQLVCGRGSRRDKDAVERFPCRMRGVFPFLAHATVKGWQLAWRHRPDVIVCSSIVAAPAAAFVGALHRIPYVLLVHGTDVVQARRQHRRAFDFFAHRAARIVANSRSTAKLIAATAPGDRISVVHPGVCSQRFGAPPPESPLCADLPAAGRPTLLTLGRLVRRKGVLEFVERVLPELVAEFPDLVYLVAGDDPKISLAHKERPRAAIERTVEKLGLTDHVRLLGAVSEAEMIALYRRADVFVLPCRDIDDDIEGFGIAVLEAAAAGVPAVVTRVGGLPEAVSDGKTGLLVAPGDDRAISDAIGALLRDPDRRDALGRSAAAQASREFDWSVVAGRYLEVFARSARESRAPAGSPASVFERQG